MAVHNIKTKEVLLGTIKTVDRTAMAGQRMKDAYIQAKQKVEHSVYSSENSSEEYAADRMTDSVAIAHKAIHQLALRSQKHIQGIKIPSVDARFKSIAPSSGTVKTKDYLQAIRTARSAVKTAEHSGNTVLNTAQTASRAARNSAKTAAKRVHLIRTAAKESGKAAKKLADAASTAIRSIIQATQSLIYALTACGTTALMVIVVILMVGALAGSCFGIFFSSQDTGNGVQMKDVVQDINTAYQNKIDGILAGVVHDKVELVGSRAVWPEVLSVYAVAVTSDPNNPQEVTTIDAAKRATLEKIFWEMNKISYKTESRKEIELIETVDKYGQITESRTEVTRIYLIVTVTHKTAWEMADQLGFDAAKRGQLSQLLDEQYKSIWGSVLYGIDSGDSMIVEVAMSQIGNVGGQPYWSWYGFSSRVEWCACFVSWCANECGYIDTGIIPKFAGCSNGVRWFKERGQWTDNSAEPIPGMIIFFDWENERDGGGLDGKPDHVGIVKKVENGRVYTIEGNTSDSCRERSYPLGHYEILGYGIPAY